MSEPIKFPPGSKVWYAPYGTELIGADSDGTPITADEDGVEPMKLLGHVVDLSEDDQ